MSLPSVPDKDKIPTRDEVVNLILSSIAMEELGLSHIINAEGEKLQYALGTIEGVTGPEKPATINDLLELNKSIHETLNGTMMNQFFLKEKMKNALSSSIMYGPTGSTGPQGPQGPATIDVDPDVEDLDPGKSPTVENVGADNKNVILKFGIPRGATGLTGKSAYEIAVEKGFDGTEAEWLAGLEGKSAYEIAVEKGFVGTEAEWLAGLEGKSAYELAVAKGFVGTEAEWLAGLEGKSAYEIAVEKGFKGTEAEWLADLEGKSAYEVAKDNGFKGTEAEWLDSLKASSVTILPFASQQAPYVGTNASGEPVNVALLGFGYLGFSTGVGGENAEVAIPIDPSDKSFNLGGRGNANRQIAFSLPFDMKLNSIYLTVGNWEAFSILIPRGTEVFPYVQIYTAPAGTNTFLPLVGAVAKPTEGLHPESDQASTMLKAEVSGLDLKLDAGTRIAICGMMEITGDSAARSYYLYFTGGVGLSSWVK